MAFFFLDRFRRVPGVAICGACGVGALGRTSAVLLLFSPGFVGAFHGTSTTLIRSTLWLRSQGHTGTPCFCQTDGDRLLR
jgi:hypothetical protein